MKKTVFLLFAFMAAITAFGQDNLALNKAAIATSGNASAAVDGNTNGTRWESAFSDPQTWQVDLGEAQAFNTISILWEGAYAKTFTIEVGDNVDADGYLTGGTQVVSVTDQSLSGFPYMQNFSFETTTARYVKFNGIARGTGYGYSFWEFGVYNLDAPLSVQTITITSAQTAASVGESFNFTAVCKDQMGGVVETPLTWTSTNPSVGTIDNGVFTAVGAGTTTITASSGSIVSNAVEINVSATAVTPPTTNPTAPTDLPANVIAVYSDTYGKGLNDNNPGWGVGGGAPNPLYNTIEESVIADGHKVVHVKGAGMNSRTQNATNLSADYYMVYAAVYPFHATEVKIFEDNSYGTAVTQSGLTPGQWNYVAINGVNFSKNYICIELVGESEFYLDHFYFAKEAVEDNVAPTLEKAELVKAGPTSVTLALKATDDKATNVNYVITDQNSVQHTVKGESGVEISYSVSNLASNTAYTFTIVAQDDNLNTSNSIQVQATTTTLSAAPSPTQDPADVISIYSDAYTPASNVGYENWGSQTVFTGIEINGDHALQFTNMNYYGIVFNAQHDVTEMENLHIDVFAENEGTLGVVPIWWNAAANVNFPEIRYTVTLTAGDWASFDIPMTAFADDSRNGTNLVHQLKLDNGNGNNIIVDNIYFWKSSSVDPTAITVEAEASEVEVGKTVQLTVLDQNANTVAASKVSFASSDESIAIVDENGVVTGVAEGNATITVTLKNNEEVNGTVDITVIAASAVEGQVLTSGDHSVTLYPYHYTGTNNYELIITSEETMTGLGGSFWHINGNEAADIRTNMTISADGKTITINATSTEDPQLYTPLYVMMPGEVNFGMVTLEWIEKGGSTAEITAITVVADENEVQVGKTLQLSVKDQDDNVVAASQVTFVSSDDAIATVDENGVVTVVAEGDVMITVTLKDNTEISSTLAIVVTAAASDALTAGEPDANGLVKLTGTWSDDEFAAIDAVKQANSYDLTEVAHEGTLDVIGKTANPYCLFVTAVPGTVNRNEVVKDGDAYNGFAFFLQEEPNANKPFDINTAIAPISVTNPFFQRLFDRAGYYVTMTVPFSYTQIPDGINGTKFYELNASSNSDGVTLTFTEVASIEANKPYLVYSGTGGITIPDAGVVSIDWNAQEESSDVASFIGNYKALQPAESENIYVVPGGVTEQSDVAFVKSAGASIRPFRAYLTLPSATKINVVFGDGEATGINGVSDEMLNALFNIYSIDGKLVKSAGEKMFNMKEGIYIINGKRVIIR